jgi:drug/metabolite transporter (DMT)-like permease
MDARKSIDSRAVGLMTVLCMVWAMQQVALKAAAVDVAPMLQIALRSGVAAVLVAGFMRWRGEWPRLASGLWRPGLVVGVLFALEFVLVAEGLRHTTASHMVVFLYTAPIFAALGLHLKLPAERLKLVQWVGIALAFAGIVWAFSGPQPAGPQAGGSSWWGDLLGLLGGACWGATTVAVRTTRLSSAPAAETLLYQLGCAFVVLLAVATATGQMGFRVTTLSVASLAFQSLVVSFASFLAWFWLLRHYLASRLGVFSFMTPLFGIVLGALLLGEPLEARFLQGAVLVVLGIVVVSSQAWWPSREPA